MPKKKEPSLLNILNAKVAKKDRVNLTRPRDAKGRFMSLLSDNAKQKFNDYKVFGDDPKKILESLNKINDSLNFYIDRYSSDIENMKQFQQSSRENRSLMVIKENQLVQHSIHGNDLLQELQSDQMNMVPIEKEILKYSKIDSQTLAELLSEFKQMRMYMHPYSGEPSFKGPTSKVHVEHQGGNLIGGLLGYDGARALEKLKGLEHRALEGEIIPPSRHMAFRPTGPGLESPVIEHEPLAHPQYHIPPIPQLPASSQVSGGGSLIGSAIAGAAGGAGAIAGRKIIGGAVSKGIGLGGRLLRGLWGGGKWLAGELGERGLLGALAGIPMFFDPNALPGSGKIADNDLAMIEKNKELSAKGYDPYVANGAPTLAANTSMPAGIPMTMPTFSGSMNVGTGLPGTVYKGPTPLGTSGKAKRLGTMYNNATPYTGPSEPITGKTFKEKAPGIMTNLMKDFNLTKDQAAGLVGNLGHESGGFTQLQEKHPIGNGPGGYGWAQWTGPRRRQYLAWAAANKLDPSSDAANYGFLKHELQTDYKGTIDALKKTKGVADATSSVEKTYEGAGIVNMSSRDAYAQAASTAYDKSQKTTEVASKDTDALMQGVKLAQNTEEAQNAKEKATAKNTTPPPPPAPPPQQTAQTNNNAAAMGEPPTVRDDNPTFIKALMSDYQNA